MWRYVIFSLMLPFTVVHSSDSAKSIVLIDSELQSLEQNFNPSDIDLIQQQHSFDWAGKLAGLNSSQAIWLKNKWLKKLSQLAKPNTQQQKWVFEQLSSTETLVMANPEHPSRPFNIVDIAQQAKATQLHWQINKREILLTQDWENKTWDWEKLLVSSDLVTKKAINQWLNKLSLSLATQVADSFWNIALDLPSNNNQILATLAKKAQSDELYQLLWQNTADEYSYQALASLPAVLDEHHAMQQSILAAQNPPLASQAFFILAAQYGHLAEAQQILLEALGQPSKKWQVAAVLSKVQDVEFAKKVKAKLEQQPPSAFSRLGLKTLLNSQMLGED
jgi:hypothetical protein